ncbi:hypothetical protein IFM89_012069 [Coptis chinensis]|uniref:Kinetochore protein Nuf2 N-terminal domain-containing protein n=1 Tax=Coptis chinensis TaxID=261450 RepID=A0A835I1R2_9MAGN|nr:hypothetical protein IFM89_012069 [Coptis chinensis]
MASSSYSFPALTCKKIATILSEIPTLPSEPQLPNITEQYLIKPTPELVNLLYKTLLCNVDLVQADDRGQLDFITLRLFENPDHHVYSVEVINLLHKVKQLLAALNMEIEEVQDEREREKPFVSVLDGKVKELLRMILDLNNYQMSLKSSFRALREKTKEIDEKITTANFTLSQLAQENAKLQSKIVQSPEKLQGCLEQKKLILDEMKNSERSAMQSYEHKCTTLEVYSKAGMKMKKRLAKMQAIQEQVRL